MGRRREWREEEEEHLERARVLVGAVEPEGLAAAVGGDERGEGGPAQVRARRGQVVLEVHQPPHRPGQVQVQVKVQVRVRVRVQVQAQVQVHL